MEIEIKSAAQFDKEIKGEKVLVDFYATWCGPCKMVAPVIAQVAGEHPELKVLKVDVDEVSDLAARYNVVSIPTMLYIEKGEVVRSRLGFAPKPQIEQFIGF